MAAVDYFLKIDGIDGESADQKHRKEIDIESWSWGEDRSGPTAAGGGGGAGKVPMQDFHFVMKVNKASPKLLLACATGEHIKKAILTCRKAGKDQQEYSEGYVDRPAGLVVPDGRVGARRRRPDRPDLAELLQDRDVDTRPRSRTGPSALRSTPAGI